MLGAPDILTYILKTTPALLTQILRDDATLLSMVFTLVPQSLSDTLEAHPEFFVDIAHRKPALVTRLFAKYPDLLMVSGFVTVQFMWEYSWLNVNGSCYNVA
jgi:hypothetical protein